MSRIKLADTSDFEDFLDRGWDEPVALHGGAISRHLGENLEERFCGIIASGERIAPVPYRSRWIPNCYRVGGMFVYRIDEDDHPFVINRDDYMIVQSKDSGRLFLEGPFADPLDHRTKEIPDRYLNVKVIGSAKNDQ